MDIPKSTLNYWIRDIIPPESYQIKLAQQAQAHINKVRVMALAKSQQLKKDRLDKIKSKNKSLVGSIDKSVAILILSTLYWCEGAKYPSHSGIRFGSSDPKMIKLFLTLLRHCYDLDESKFRLTVQCRADQDVIELAEYWQQVTGIQEFQHYKPHIDKRTIGKPTKRENYKGVCVIDYFNTNLQCELQFTGKMLGDNSSLQKMKKQIE